MASIHRIETGDGPRYRVRWRNRADPRLHSTTCRTHEAARRVKLAAETAHDVGQPYLGPDGEAEAALARRVDLHEAVTDYLRDRRRAGRSDATIRQTDIALSLFLDSIDPNPSAIPGEALTTAALGAYYDHLRAVRGCSLGTARARVEYVERWWAWLGNSDAWADRVPRPRRIELAPAPAPPEAVAPTWEEMDRAIACAWGWYGQLMTVARYTGLRAEDQVLALRRDDIDLAQAQLRIRPELGKTRAEKRGRVVPLSRHLVAMVRGWPQDPDGWLVHVPRFNATKYPGPVKRRAWNAQAAGAWRRAGVRPEIWDTQPSEDGHRKNGHPLHAFRRGLISGLQALGAPLEDVQYLVGHQIAGGVTVERYTDPRMVRRLREAVDLVPSPSLIEVRAIQGGACVTAGAPPGRWRAG